MTPRCSVSSVSNDTTVSLPSGSCGALRASQVTPCVHTRPTSISYSDSATRAYREARQADYVAFLHRVPFAIDALNMGFLPGFREDCSYQQQQFIDLECPVGMLDNDFRSPNLDRYVNRVFEHEPRVGIVGDAYDAVEARRYVDAIRELEGSFPDSEFIVVPKCREAIEAIPDDITLGYSRGYADTLAHEFSDPAEATRRDRPTHPAHANRRPASGDRQPRLERRPSGCAVRRVLDRRQLGR